MEWFKNNLGFSPWHALIFAGLIWLLRLAIIHFFKSEVEITKEKLSQEGIRLSKDLDKQLLGHKHELEVLRLKNQIQFSKLHEKRFKTIEELYQKLVELNGAMNSMMSQLKGVSNEEENRMKESHNSMIEFSKYFLINKIYFNSEQVRLIEIIINVYSKTGWDYNIVYRMKQTGAEGRELKGHYQAAKEASEELRTTIPPLLESLESQFRSVLEGIEN